MADEESLNRRSRARQACEPCRKKKTKCSGEYPICSNCSSHGFECRYIAIEKRRGPQKGYVRALESRLDSLQNLLEDYVEKISPSVSSNSQMGPLMDGGEVFFDEGEDCSSNHSSPPADKQDSNSQLVISSSVSHSRSDSSSLLPRSQRPPLQTMTQPKKAGHLTLIENGSQKYLGESSGAYLLQQVKDEEVKILQFPNGAAFSSSSAQPLNPNFIIPKAQLDAFISLYFSTVHCHLPILIKDDFLSEYSKKDSTIPPVLLDAMCAASSAFSSRVLNSSSITEPLKLGEACYNRARQQVLTVVDLASTANIQIFLLLSICNHVFIGSAGWINLGIALRMALEIGLHRDYVPTDSDPLSLKEREVRRRLWWGCYMLDRLACVSAGRPLTIDEDEYDTPLPELCGESEEGCPIAINLSSTVPSLQPRRKYFYKFVGLCQIYGKVTRNIYSVKSRQGYSALKLQSHIQHIDDTLQSWYLTLSREWPQFNESSSFNNEYYTYGLSLQINYHTLVILLHRPLLPRPTASISSFARTYYDKCHQSASKILELINRDIEAYLDMGTFFKIYPLLVAFSIHILSASSSNQDSTHRQESKALALSCLCTISRFSNCMPLCNRILFGSMGIVTSLDIIPIGFVDSQWPDALKQASRAYASYITKDESVKQDSTESLVQQKTVSTATKTDSAPTTAPRQLNPTQFLQAQARNELKRPGHDSSPSSTSGFNVQASSSPGKKFKETPPQNIQPQATQPTYSSVPYQTQPNFIPTIPQQHPQQIPINTSSGYLGTQYNNAMQNPMLQAINLPQTGIPGQLDMNSQQQFLYNSLLQSRPGSNPTMMPFMSNGNPSDFMPMGNSATMPGNQQGSETFIWDPLYNFDFSGFNNNGM